MSQARDRRAPARIDVTPASLVDQVDAFAPDGDRRPRLGGSVKDMFGPHRLPSMVLVIVTGQAAACFRLF
jgi:hypothetical protein